MSCYFFLYIVAIRISNNNKYSIVIKPQSAGFSIYVTA